MIFHVTKAKVATPDSKAFCPDAPERRYLVKDASAILAALEAHVAKGQTQTFDTDTVYLDLPGGTWSKGVTGTKWRLRRYTPGDGWWFETKHREGDEAQKTRKFIGTSLDKFNPGKLQPVSSVRYRRRAFSLPGGLRVTIDSDLTAERPGHKKARTLDGYIVEVKRSDKIPPWLEELLPKEDHHFSKSKFSLKRCKVKIH